jgi:hypothetical protein
MMVGVWVGGYSPHVNRKQRERKEESEQDTSPKGTRYISQGHTSNDLHPVNRSHLLKFPESPKITAAARDQVFNNSPIKDISYSKNNK